MTRQWGALLSGHEFDLEDWLDTLKPGFDPWTERHGADTVLRSATFANLANVGDVRTRALALIDLLNGAVAVSRGTDLIGFGGVVEFRPDGEMHKTVFGSVQMSMGRARVTATAVLIGPDGQVMPPRPPTASEVQHWARIADANDALSDALVFHGRTANWFDIYKAIECLEAFAGGSERKLLAKNWAPSGKIKLMKRTANFSRHAMASRPAKPMDLLEARSLLSSLLRQALASAERRK